MCWEVDTHKTSKLQILENENSSYLSEIRTHHRFDVSDFKCSNFAFLFYESGIFFDVLAQLRHGFIYSYDIALFNLSFNRDHSWKYQFRESDRVSLTVHIFHEKLENLIDCCVNKSSTLKLKIGKFQHRL